jgi:hypothetical protein
MGCSYWLQVFAELFDAPYRVLYGGVMKKQITAGVIGLAVMLLAISGLPAVMLEPKEPAWAVMSRDISQEALAVGELTERMALALYEADQKTAAQAATSLLEQTKKLPADAPACLAGVVQAQGEYYELVHQSSVIVIDAIKTKKWEQLITAGELLLLAEEASARLADSVLALDPLACD